MSSAVAPVRRKGQPIIVLAAVCVGWVSARALLWNPPFDPDAIRGNQPSSTLSPTLALSPTTEPSKGQHGFAIADDIPPEVCEADRCSVAVSQATVPTILGSPTKAREVADAPFVAPPFASRPPDRPASLRVALATPVEPARPVFATGTKRWSVDSWFFWRSGSGLPSGTNTQFGGRYGATQAGLVARYDLGSNRRRPQAYVRFTHAPDRPAQSDVAAGIGFRPVPSLPIRMQAEARALHTQGRTSVAPAVLAISELPVFDLPLGFSGEAYGQAGWVGGDFATPFVDGQLRLDRPVLHAGPVELRLGGGVWGGAQKSAERLDAGPGLTLDFRDGGLPARVSVDYRFKVAGDASPGNGIAVTLSTGF